MAKNLLIIAGIFLFTCSMRTNNKESFEGIITYKITYTPKNPDKRYNDYQQKKFGDTLVLYISKNGDFKKEYPTSGEMGYDYYTYLTRTNKAYLKWRNQDTLATYDCSLNSLKIKSEIEKPSETIHNIVCKGYCITLVDSSNSRRPMLAILTYYYPSNKEYIDPKLYTQHHDFFYNKTMNKIQAPYYKHTLDMGSYEVTFELVKIQAKELSPVVFKIN
ncbi:MAG: hypothetical protein SGJ10_02670 [Bacteroidota bacterium]|nr:hypothetical protein [Bacteroidota bacterium]